jgi:hypothetical protein
MYKGQKDIFVPGLIRTAVPFFWKVSDSSHLILSALQSTSYIRVILIVGTEMQFCTCNDHFTEESRALQIIFGEFYTEH